jgi:hypothetical protein
VDHDRSWRVRKISPPPEMDSQTIQPVASRYTGYSVWYTRKKAGEAYNSKFLLEEFQIGIFGCNFISHRWGVLQLISNSGVM